MSKKVAQLFTDNVDIIEHLQTLLARAERGEIVSLAVAVELRKESIATGYKIGKDGNVWMLLGALAKLHHRLLNPEDEE